MMLPRRHCRVAAVVAFILGLLLYTLPPALSQNEEEKRPVYVLTMDGAISPAFSGYLDKGIAAAKAGNAQLLVIELDTPGGLLSSTRDMTTSIVESPVPVAVWVTPSGAHAASAGTFILYAAHIAAMDEGTNIGAATPIQMKGQVRGQLDETAKGTKARGAQAQKDEETENSLRELLEKMKDPNEEAMQRKAIQDTTAFIRGLAELRGRNAEWAEKAVTDAESITSSEALEKNVIEYIALNRADLLKQVHGKTIAVKNGEPVTLDTETAPVTELPPDWKTKLLTFITDPNIAMILMSIGTLGIMLEFYNPGTLIPGTIGGICLILGLYAMNVLPINMAGAALMLLGAAFMVAELFMPSFGIMGIGGLVAFLVGAIIMFDTEGMPGLGLDWGVVAAIGFSGLLVMGGVILFTIRAYRHKTTTGLESMIGSEASVEEWAGTKGRVRIQGEIWHAFSEFEMELEKGADVRVCGVDGLSLKVEAAG